MSEPGKERGLISWSCPSCCQRRERGPAKPSRWGKVPSPRGPCITRALLDRRQFPALAWNPLCLAAPTASGCFPTCARPVACVACWALFQAKKRGTLGILQTTRANRLVSGQFFPGGVGDGCTKVHRQFGGWRGVAWASSTYLIFKNTNQQEVSSGLQKRRIFDSRVTIEPARTPVTSYQLPVTSTSSYWLPAT